MNPQNEPAYASGHHAPRRANQEDKQSAVDKRLLNVRKRANTYRTPTSKVPLLSSSERGNALKELPNTEDNIQSVLQILEDITFEEIAHMVKLKDLFKDDAGGQFIMAVKDEFLEIVRKMFSGMNSLSTFPHPYNYVLGAAGDKALSEMDEIDKYDTLMSIIGYEATENIRDVEFLLRGIAKGTTFSLWDRVIAAPQ